MAVAVNELFSSSPSHQGLSFGRKSHVRSQHHQPAQRRRRPLPRRGQVKAAIAASLFRSLSSLLCFPSSAQEDAQITSSSSSFNASSASLRSSSTRPSFGSSVAYSINEQHEEEEEFSWGYPKP